MRRIEPGWFSRLVSLLVWLLLLAAAGFAVRSLLHGKSAGAEVLAAAGVAPGQERLVMALGAAILGGAAIWMGYRIFYLGLPCLTYNEETVTFIFSRRDSRSYRWEELWHTGIALRSLDEIEPLLLPFMRGIFFQFPDGRRFPVRVMQRGYGDFAELLRRKRLMSG